MPPADLPPGARGALVAAVVATVAGTGCDKLFSLDQVVDASATQGDVRGDGSRDGSTADDEDGDGVPNATDKCPVTADADQIDGDGDSVGDACDPQPTQPVERIAVVSYFNDPDAIDGGWAHDTPNWSITGGVLENTGPLELMQVLGTSTERATIEIAYTATHWEDLTSSMRISIETNTVYVPCHVDYNTPEWIAFLDNGSFVSVPESVSRHVLRLTAVTGPASCALNQGVPGESVLTVPAGASDVRAEFVDTIRANLEYIIVYETRSP